MAFTELVALVLIVDFVILPFGAVEAEDETAVAGLPCRWQANALRVGGGQVHFEQNGVGAAKVCDGVERCLRFVLARCHNSARCGD